MDAAVAELLGINRTDLTILGGVHRQGRITAGEAAATAHLSPAATSAAIARLTAAGLLHRAADAGDRRRAVLTLTGQAAEAIQRAYGPIGDEGHARLERWSTEELRIIERFLTEGIRFQLRHADRIRTQPR